MSETVDTKQENYQKLLTLITRLPSLDKNREGYVSISDDYGIGYFWRQNGMQCMVAFTPFMFEDRPNLRISSRVDVSGTKGEGPNPLIGTATTLALIANIQAIAEKNDKPVLHIVSANKHSKGIFEKLVQAGIYRYSYKDGEISTVPIDDTDEVHRTYSCSYPLSDSYKKLKMEIERYTFPELVEEVIDFVKL